MSHPIKSHSAPLLPAPLEDDTTPGKNAKISSPLEESGSKQIAWARRDGWLWGSYDNGLGNQADKTMPRPSPTALDYSSASPVSLTKHFHSSPEFPLLSSPLRPAALEKVISRELKRPFRGVQMPCSTRSACIACFSLHRAVPIAGSSAPHEWLICLHHKNR
ncbi:hypothetical protein BU24DRAFT_408270 [Aaosphaeria arxii CBS 175.79]|uniref:Uncharacterized protein n=1 Tax=Aaosphaeria arxii CBS 175.79 TaxID=1450172 RepID=A0A6A5XZE6_9PLEO|nr:uncharacterized protein BU24DRAFT_408270 [Aaosphaeria arxii CBS 175.79]KAF2018346.1 hypothetical protein BU24DRAFT_408270 [Aaosphaeria arxii CBS 175.79]